ncbi:MAG: hypothetical protein PF517_00100 [Salinivirgaceae bacterium]|jgi:hypothetical protein|nr:hypothetical protein [Salinivirgaceae bacterium]
MDKKMLLSSAKLLNQVSENAVNEYAQKSEQLIAKMNALMLDRADIDNLVGEDNRNMMTDNHSNHVRFIASILKNNNSVVLVETVLWVFRAYRSHGFKTNYWAAQLNFWILVLKEILTAESYKEIYPYYEWMQINIPIFVKVSNENLEASNSMH